MKLMNNVTVPPFRYENVVRPWGQYGLYADNEKCTTKILYIKPNELLSLQYHFKRDQFYLLLDDNFIIQYSSVPIDPTIANIEDDYTRITMFQNFLQEHLQYVEGKEGDMFGFHKFVVHRAMYTGNRQYGRILDIAFGDNDESDIVRISDKYGR